ncbi:permease for cytosine/purines, uracil, thiamine, allantoin-domain-containing protein [Lipomyces starkeyi]
MTSLADTASDIEKNEKHSGAVASEPEFDDIDVQDGAVREKGLAADWPSPAYFWWAVNMVLSPVAIGLGISIFGMTFSDSTLTIIFFTIFGTIPVAFYSLFGPEFGLRKMIISRFWFGYHGVKIFAILNVIGCIGWSALSTVNAASILHSINGGGLPTWAGMLIVATGTMFLTLLALRVPQQAGRHMQVATRSIRKKMSAGPNSSFVSCSVYPVNTPHLQDAYNENGIGGLLYGVVVTDSLHGFGQFCLVALALSTIVVLCANIDSIAFSMQTISHYLALFRHCPAYCVDFPRYMRVLWNFCGRVLLGAYYNFESYMANFMNIIGYWLCIYEAISLPEHFWFRGGFSGYDVEDITHPELLPPGYSTLFSLCCRVAGIVVGMYQVWWTGPIARMIPGDLGFELTFVFTFVAYVATRPLEKRYFGR